MNQINKTEQLHIEKGTSLWANGLERGHKMAEFIDIDIMDLADCTILDLGCGMGGISLAFAQRSKKVISGDYNFFRLKQVKKRMKTTNAQNMLVSKFDARELPFKNETFDVVIMNGVFEYMGINDDGVAPEELQIRALKEANRIIKKNGIIYIGIENRWYPAYLFKDVHCGLPLVAMLPRKAADIVSLILSKRPYQTYIHSYWKLKKMVTLVGFNESSFFTPIFNYQYPIFIKALSNRREILRSLDTVYKTCASDRYKKMSFGNTPKIKVNLFKFITRIGFLKLFSPCFVVIARRKGD